MRTRPILAFTVAALLGGCAGQSPRLPTKIPAISRSAFLKLADWNMEFLAEKDGTGCQPRTPADYAAIRRTISKVDADVFAFEEVENERAAARVFDTAKYTIVMEARPGKPGGKCGGEHTDQAFIRQAVGIAIKKGLPFSRGPDLTALQLANPNLRSGVDITIRPRGGEPLRVLAIHLKSGCFQGQTGRACPEILQQMPVIKAWVQAAATEGSRFVIMGDWNRRLALPGDVFWSTIDMQTPPNADLVLADAGIEPHCDPRYRDFIDHIVLDRKAGAQVVAFTETTFPDGKRPSDHCPLSVMLPR